MARIYFGGADEQSPMPALGTQDWSTVNPPEVTAAALEFENKRREAEQERAMLEQMQGRDMAETQKAMTAALKFQGIRGMQAAIAGGMAPQEALGKFAHLVFADRPGAMVNLPREKPAAQVKEIPTPAGTIRQITQPSGSIQETLIKPATPVRDPQLTEMDRRTRAAQTALDQAAMEKDALSATRPEVIPAYAPGGFKRFFGATPRPAVTNQVPLFDKEKVAEAMAKFEAARKRLDTTQADRAAYLSPPGTNAPAAKPAASGKALTKDALREFYRQAGGDKAKAMQLAKEAGYTF